MGVEILNSRVWVCESEEQEADRRLGWISGRKVVLSKHQAACPLGDLRLPQALTSSEAAPQDARHSGKTAHPFLVLGSQVAADWLLHS